VSRKIWQPWAQPVNTSFLTGLRKRLSGKSAFLGVDAFVKKSPKMSPNPFLLKINTQLLSQLFVLFL
jgi:hypothetical protein